MKLIGLRKACSASKSAQPYTFYVQINVDVTTGEIYTIEHSDVNSETRYHDHNLIHVLTTSSPLTMSQIKEFCQIAIHDHQLLKEYYNDLHRNAK